MSAVPRRLRPLLVRPGARFTCFVDGFCCSDIHKLGPLDRGDVRRLRLAGVGHAVAAGDGDEPVLRRAPGGACTLLDGGRCTLHDDRGSPSKPGLCQRYPYVLVATPLGGRVTTAHRCPCRTMGERAPITPSSVEASLTGPDGKLVRDRDGPANVRLTTRTSVSFARYVELEAPTLARLAAGAPPASVLAVDPGLPALAAGAWREIAALYAAYGVHAIRGCQSLAWFGDGIRLALGEAPPPRGRPWSDAFDRAEARVTEPEPPAKILGDWFADLLWGLSWADHGPLDRGRATIGALASIAAAIAARLVELGARPDRAAAEALLIAESGACHRLWADAVALLRPASGWMTTRGDP